MYEKIECDFTELSGEEIRTTFDDLKSISVTNLFFKGVAETQDQAVLVEALCEYLAEENTIKNLRSLHLSKLDNLNPIQLDKFLEAWKTFAIQAYDLDGKEVALRLEKPNPATWKKVVLAQQSVVKHIAGRQENKSCRELNELAERAVDNYKNPKATRKGCLAKFSLFSHGDEGIKRADQLITDINSKYSAQEKWQELRTLFQGKGGWDSEPSQPSLKYVLFCELQRKFNQATRLKPGLKNVAKLFSAIEEVQPVLAQVNLPNTQSRSV